ncbi:MAG: GT4 family glycosyltransferase PelF [Burkholderiaceae bacterium]
MTPPTDTLRQASAVDVLLLLEGTFPFVRGGVSSWVDQIIRGFPELRFGAIFLGSQRKDYGAPRYALPANLVHLECFYIHEPIADAAEPRTLSGDAAAFARSAQLHEGLRDPAHAAAANTLLGQLLPLLAPGGALDAPAFLHSHQAWMTVTRNYKERCTDPSFVDYFWTVRTMHAPIWRLLAAAKKAPRARVLHTVSTGYAGFLGCLLTHTQGAPLLVSEHGIYTKERKIDLFQSEWLRDNRSEFERGGELAYFRGLWIRFFEALGRSCYASAHNIVALFETNRLRQIADGAPAHRTRNIPNGVPLERYVALRAQREFGADRSPPPVACLIGRVVPIKDIKTFIRAMRTVLARLPTAQAWIAGPDEEDPEYARECHLLVDSLGLTNNVKFLGFQDIAELLPKVGLVVLSSISEGLPLVVLEGYAAGTPCVTTDVGSCRQLVYGIAPDDTAIGASGEVVRIADPGGLGEAIARLLAEPDRWHAASRAAVERVETFYTDRQMFDAYRALYDDAMNPATTED